MLRNEDKGWVFAMHRCPKEPGGVGGIAWDGDVDPGIMGEGSFVRLTVPEAPTRKISAIGSVEHERASPCAKGAPAQVAEIGHELIPRRSDEVDKLQFEDRPPAIRSEPAG